MTGLPASVEAHLTEAGFAPTEIMALRKLLEGEALTLRELASKTGKSTGVLDLSVKKLMSRGIVTRETFNSTPKYLVKSLDAVLAWMREDMEAKRKMLARKERDFESFIASLKSDQLRPEMEYFAGREGVEKAYRKLLESVKDKQLLRFYPVTCREEEDPLRDFRVQYFRERHKRGIFSRVIAQDTALSRRYRSRDAFEYRETVLVPESEFPYDFEKIIAGDTVACFTVSEEKAYFIRSAALARSERELFEVTWRKAKAAAGAPVQPASAQQNAAISLSAKTLSSVREFFLSRESVILFTACAVLAAGITFGLWRHNVWLNTERVRERAMAIAATAAPEFDFRDFERLHVEEDMRTEAYQKVFKKLNDIRNRNPGVKWSYVFRPAEDLHSWEFIADADSNFNLPRVNLSDWNKDGVIDKADENVWPGEIYDATQYGEVASESLKGPVASNPTTEPWGTWISGWAPIKDATGKTVAVYGVDIDVKNIEALTRQTFFPIYYFLGFFLLFVFIRLAAFNRPLFMELLKVLRSRRVVLSLGLCALIALGVTYGMYRSTLSLMKQEVGQRLMAIAATAAPEIDARDLESLRFARDMKRPEYQRVFQKLNEIRDQNENIQWIYILRPTDQENIWEFVADADSNYFLPNENTDYNHDGMIDEADEGVAPGVAYDIKQQLIGESGLIKPLFETTIVSDQWGSYMTASAPIMNSEGKGIAVLALDMNIATFQEAILNGFSPFFWFFLILFTLVGFRILLLIASFHMPTSRG